MAVLVAASADDDLPLALLAIALRANGRQGVVGPFQGATRDLRQKEVDGLGLGALGIESVLDGGWGSRQPIQVLVQRLLINPLSAPHIPSGMRHRQTHGREACPLSDHPSHDVPQCQLPCAGRPQRLCAPQASSDVVHSPDRTKGPSLVQRDRVLDSPQVLQGLLVAQRQPQCLDSPQRNQDEPWPSCGGGPCRWRDTTRAADVASTVCHPGCYARDRDT